MKESYFACLKLEFKVSELPPRSKTDAKIIHSKTFAFLSWFIVYK